MKESKMHIINKIFSNSNIRTIWDKKEEKYYISIIDVISILSGSKRPRKYWNDLKKKLFQEGSELSEKIGQLKLKAEDGKYRFTDICDTEEMFRIIESVPSKAAEPFKIWLAKLGSERIDEIFDPSISLQRAIDLYRIKGMDELWISKRIKALQERKQLTDLWLEGGIKVNEYAIITNEIYKTWSGMTAKEYKEYKGLKKENLRDNMDNIELILTDLSEEATKKIIEKKKPIGLGENIQTAKLGGNVAKVAKEELEKQLEIPIITTNNKLGYKKSNKE